jgi:solute carrier family 45 protein 1/2/4
LDQKFTRDEKDHPESSGVQAYLFFAVVAFYCSIVLPLLKPTVSSTESPPNLSQISFEKWLKQVTLPRLWLLSQIVFALLMFCTIFLTGSLGGIFIVALCGFSWSLTQWVPLAMMSAEIASMREASRCDGEVEGEDETGSLMSIFNVAISAPQILAGGLCSLLFWVIGNGDAVYSLGWALRMGGVAAVLSVVLMGAFNRRW